MHVGPRHGDVAQRRNFERTNKPKFDARPTEIEFASEFYTIYPGDVLFTGSPPGVSQVQPGDVMHCACDQIGEMTVTVRAAE